MNETFLYNLLIFFLQNYSKKGKRMLNIEEKADIFT